MKQYLDLVKTILDTGELKPNRTGIDTLSITGAMLKFDLREGFPILTTRKAPIKSTLTELEFFIHGYQDKKWLEDRNCKFWSDWCNPTKVPYGNDPETKKKMAQERDLGPIYGAIWRDFNYNVKNWYEKDNDGNILLHEDKPIDQLKNVIHTLKTNPLDRRMLVSAYNPSMLYCQALPPCHYMFQFVSDGKHLDLTFNMRSNDLALGCPANFSQYSMLLMLVAEEVKMIPRHLVYFGSDVHIYVNHIESLKEQLKRTPKQLPKMSIIKHKENWTIFDWDSQKDWKLEGYDPYPPIKMEVAV